MRMSFKRIERVTRILAVALFAAACIATASEAQTIATIKSRGKLIVGGKHDVPKFGFKNTQTGAIEGFESDIIRLIAKELLGDEKKVEIVHVTASTRLGLLNNGEIDFIMATMTVTEQRKRADRAEAQTEALLHSRTFRIGSLLLAPARLALRGLRAARERVGRG